MYANRRSTRRAEIVERQGNNTGMAVSQKTFPGEDRLGNNSRQVLSQGAYRLQELQEYRRDEPEIFCATVDERSHKTVISQWPLIDDMCRLENGSTMPKYRNSVDTRRPDRGHNVFFLPPTAST